MKAIVKVQRPFAPPDGPWLIYDRERRHEDLVDAVPVDVRAALGAAVKGYFTAKRTHSGWLLGRRVADQPW